MVRTMKVDSIVQTCPACPSQWEGTLDDGRMIYIRYRWGRLSVRVSPEPTNDIGDAVRGDEIHASIVGESGWDGSITLDEVKHRVGDLLEW